MHEHPLVAARSCEDCLAFLYDEQTGKTVLRAGRKQKRHHGCPPPCRTSIGCAKGTPEEPVGLTPKNELAFQHYLESKAVGAFPDDGIVRQNAAAIRGVEDAQERRDQMEYITALTGAR